MGKSFVKRKSRPQPFDITREKGLIVSIGRKGLRRQYSHHVLEQLAVISLGTQAGFSLEELQGFIEKSSLSIDRQRLLEKAEELDKKDTKNYHLLEMGFDMRQNVVPPATWNVQNSNV